MSAPEKEITNMQDAKRRIYALKTLMNEKDVIIAQIRKDYDQLMDKYVYVSNALTKTRKELSELKKLES